MTRELEADIKLIYRSFWTVDAMSLLGSVLSALKGGSANRSILNRPVLIRRAVLALFVAYVLFQIFMFAIDKLTNKSWLRCSKAELNLPVNVGSDNFIASLNKQTLCEENEGFYGGKLISQCTALLNLDPLFYFLQVSFDLGLYLFKQ